MNDQCYVLERLKVKSGIFDEIIDACYIIHLTGSSRLNSVLKQTYELISYKYIYFNRDSCYHLFKIRNESFI